MTLCTGLAILGLCIPLPGTKVSAIQEAGWWPENDQPGAMDWYATRWMSSGTYSLLVGLSGPDRTEVGSIMLREKRGDTSSRLKAVIDRMCKASKQPFLSCTL